jgi:CubicO group peptidase (beta-lactamase class C family)
MQLVEAGQVSLDEPVYKHIPELESLKVLKSFTDAGEPIEEKHTNPITLRRLLSHSSGLTYASIHPKAMAWLKYHNREDSNSGKLLERFDCPLMFEPGEAWCYGPSIDFAGLLVERVTGQTLEEYMKKNLWEPLNIRDMTFKPSSRPDLQERMADMSVRDETGKVRWTGAVMVHQGKDGKEAEDCFGGHGCFTSAEEYLKVLHAVLNRDEKILKKETFEEFFRPQLSEGSAAALNHVLQDDAVRPSHSVPLFVPISSFPWSCLHSPGK